YQERRTADLRGSTRINQSARIKRMNLRLLNTPLPLLFRLYLRTSAQICGQLCSPYGRTIPTSPSIRTVVPNGAESRCTSSRIFFARSGAAKAGTPLGLLPAGFRSIG